MIGTFKGGSMRSNLRVYMMTVGALMILVPGGCTKDSTGTQGIQYPTNPVPADGATNQPVHLTLAWQDGDADHPAQSWDVCFGIYNNPPTVSSAQSARTYELGTLAPSTTYHWNVVARYSDGGQTRGPEWTFTTSSGN